MSELFLAYKGIKFDVSWNKFSEWKQLFGSLDLFQEFQFMDDWLRDHPTRRGTNAFIKGWLRREQRKASTRRIESSVGSGPSDTSVVRLKRK